MNAHAGRNWIVVACGLAVVAGTIASRPMVFAAEQAAQQVVVVGRDREIFGTQAAADLVAEARSHDPMYCPVGRAHRDKAIQLYQRARAAQPGAPINAVLANRVAQLYAFYQDSAGKVTPSPGLAGQWWDRCLGETDKRQLLWAQTQMGRASMAVVRGDLKAALAAYNAILEVDPAELNLPNWRAWPDNRTAAGQAVLAKERAGLGKAIARVQTRAVQKRFYVLCRIDRNVALEALQTMSVKYRGTPAGLWASNTVDHIRESSAVDPLALPDLSTGGDAEPPHQVTAAAQGPSVEDVAPVTAPAAMGTDEHQWYPGIAVCAILGAALTAAGALWVRSRNGRMQKGTSQ